MRERNCVTSATKDRNSQINKNIFVMPQDSGMKTTAAETFECAYIRRALYLTEEGGGESAT